MTSDSLEPTVVSRTIRNLAISNAVNLFLLAALLFAALFICAGAGLLLYLLLWSFVPSE